MAKEKTDKKDKAAKRFMKERKERRIKKLRHIRGNKETNTADDPQDELVIDGIGYKTLLTPKYLKRKKYETLDLNKITAFIPGTVLNIFVKNGDKVSKGDDLLILEAMKMNNKIIAPHDAVVKKICVKPGEMVSRNHLLVELKS